MDFSNIFAPKRLNIIYFIKDLRVFNPLNQNIRPDDYIQDVRGGEIKIIGDFYCIRVIEHVCHEILIRHIFKNSLNFSFHPPCLPIYSTILQFYQFENDRKLENPSFLFDEANSVLEVRDVRTVEQSKLLIKRHSWI